MLLRKVVGYNLEKYRKKLHLSQGKLYCETGVTAKTTSSIENCMRDCKLETLEILAKGVDVQPFELFLDKEKFDCKVLLDNPVLLKGVLKILAVYYPILQELKNEEISDKPYRTYGIAVEGDCVPCVNDVTTDEKFAESIARLLTKMGVDPIHLPEVLQDIL